MEIMGCSVSLACSPPPLCDTKGCGCTILPVPLSQLRGFGWRESLLWYSHVLQLALEARCCLQIISLHCCPVWRVPTSWGSCSRSSSHPSRATGSPTLRTCVLKNSPCPALELCPHGTHRSPSTSTLLTPMRAEKKEQMGEFAGNPALIAPVPCLKATLGSVGL